MNTLENFIKELEIIESEISTKEISNEIYSLISLLNKRVLLGKKISQYKWDKLEQSEKEKERESDFNTTKAYFEKFQDEVANKFNYKREYLDFYFEAKRLSSLESSKKNIYSIVLDILNTKEYINVSEKACLHSIIEYINIITPVQARDLLIIYNRLVSMTFELK